MPWTRRSLAATIQHQMDEYRKAQGRRVAQLRDAKSWTQEDLARETEMAVKTISRIENGHNELRSTTLRKLAKALGVTESEIRGTPPAPLGLDARDEDRFELDTIAILENQARIEAKLDRILAVLGEAPTPLADAERLADDALAEIARPSAPARPARGRARRSG